MSITFLKTIFISASVLLLLAFTTEETVIIKISSPGIKSVYKVMDTVWIKANVSSTGALHNVNIRVISLVDSAVVYSKQIHSHSTSMDINEFYINPVLDKSDMKLVISTTGHEGKEIGNSEVIFKCLEKKKKG